MQLIKDEYQLTFGFDVRSTDEVQFGKTSWFCSNTGDIGISNDMFPMSPIIRSPVLLGFLVIWTSTPRSMFNRNLSVFIGSFTRHFIVNFKNLLNIHSTNAIIVERICPPHMGGIIINYMSLFWLHTLVQQNIKITN